MSPARRRALRLLRRMNQPAARYLGVLTHVVTDAPVIALTFDDGPHPEWTPRVFDLLAAHGARATFFIVGAMAERHPRLVERALAEGHTLGNHSWSHASLPSIPAAERQRQLDWDDALFRRQGPALFRPPFGDLDWRTRVALKRRSYQVIGWNVSVLDWQPRTVEEMLEVLERRARPGSIVLLHDQLFQFAASDEPRRENLLEALSVFLRRSDLRFVTVPELLAAGRAHFEVQLKRSDPEWLRSLASVSALGFKH